MASAISPLSSRDIAQAVVCLCPWHVVDVPLVWPDFQGLPILRRRSGLVLFRQGTAEDVVRRDVFRIAGQGVFPQGFVVLPKAVCRQVQAIRAASITAEPMPNTHRRAGHDAPSRIAPQTRAM